MEQRRLTFEQLCVALDCDIEELTPYQIRVSYNGSNILDFYPKSCKIFNLLTKKWCQLGTNYKGQYKSIQVWESQIENIINSFKKSWHTK